MIFTTRLATRPEPIRSSESPEVVGIAKSRRAPAWLVPGLLVLFGSLAVINAVLRLSSILHGTTLVEALPASREAAWLEHPYVAALHLVPGIAFMLLGPFQFSPAIRRRWPVWHRRAGRAYVASGICVGTSSIWLAGFFPMGGLLKYSATVLFGAALVASILFAVLAILRRDVAQHRAWMIRGYSLGLAVATQRVYFVAVSLLMGEMSDLTLGIGVWVTWTFHLAVAELIVARGRNASRTRKHAVLPA